MTDYTWPSVYFSYFLFFLLVAGAAWFLVRSRRDGYWGSDSEAPKYRMLEDDNNDDPSLPDGIDAQRRTL